MSAGHLADVLRARLGIGAWLRATTEHGVEVIVVEPERYVPVVRFLRADPDAQLEVLSDLFAVDRGPAASPRFELRASLRSPRLGYRAHIVLEIGARGAADAEPVVPTLTGLFVAAEPLERELFEMHGIVPDGHPQLRPLLLYAGFVGHPLRKDYRAHKEQPLVPLLDDVPAPTILVDAPAVAAAASREQT